MLILKYVGAKGRPGEHLRPAAAAGHRDPGAAPRASPEEALEQGQYPLGNYTMLCSTLLYCTVLYYTIL